MRKKAILLTVLLLGLLTSVFVNIHPVKALTGLPPYFVNIHPEDQFMEVNFEVTSGPPLTGSPPGTVTVQVNQRVEFTAVISGGTPPYTYQWSILLWNDDISQLMFNCTYIDIPGATSSKFEYREYISGKYEICVDVNDSAGQTLSASGPIVDVQVLPSQVPISSTSEPFPTTLIIATSVVMAVVGIGLLVYFKKRKH